MQYADEDTIKEYFLKLRNGETIYREKIIMNYVDLIAYIVVKKLNISYTDDYVSEGIIGLIKAVDSYDINKNVKFIAYASICIKNQIIMFERKNYRYSNILSLDNFYYDKNGDQVSFMTKLEDLDCDILQQYIDKETMEQVFKIISTLDSRSQLILKIYFGIGCEPKKQREIANILGISRSYVARIIYDSLKTIRNELDSKALTKTQ